MKIDQYLNQLPKLPDPNWRDSDAPKTSPEGIRAACQATLAGIINGVPATTTGVAGKISKTTMKRVLGQNQKKHGFDLEREHAAGEQIIKPTQRNAERCLQVATRFGATPDEIVKACQCATEDDVVAKIASLPS
jgi:hypothetical protein